MRWLLLYSKMVRSSCSSSLLTKIIRYAHYGFIKGNISSSVSNQYAYNIQSSQISELELPSFRPVPLSTVLPWVEQAWLRPLFRRPFDRCFIICTESVIIIHLRTTVYSLAYAYTTASCSDLRFHRTSGKLSLAKISLLYYALHYPFIFLFLFLFLTPNPHIHIHMHLP